MPTVLITGAGRRAGIAAACALTLARAGWDVGLSCWRLYDRKTGLASGDREPLDLVEELAVAVYPVGGTSRRGRVPRAG